MSNPLAPVNKAASRFVVRIVVLAALIAAPGRALAQEEETPREQATAALKRGSALYAKKDLVGAMTEYRKAIELDPKFAPAYNALGVALRDQKDVKGAIAQFRKATEVDPKMELAFRNLGVMLHSIKDFDGSVAAFRKTVEINPKSANVRFNLALALANNKDLDGAIAEYRKAVELDPKSAPIHFGLGVALHENKDSDAAIAVFRKVIELDPKHVKAHFNLGHVLSERQRVDEAIAVVEKGLKVAPQDPLLHNLMGGCLTKNKDRWPEAEAALRKAIQLDPKFAIAHFNLGLLYFDMGKFADAEAVLQKATVLNPKLAEAFDHLGNSLFQQRKYDEAIVAHQKSLAINPRQAVAQRNLGAALYELKRHDEALIAIRKSIELDPRYVRAHFLLGRTLHAQKKWGDSLAALDKVLELEPKHPQAYFNIGVCRIDQRQWPEAEAALLKAAGNNPKLPDVHDMLGTVYVAQGSFDRATAATRQAIELLPAGDVRLARFAVRLQALEKIQEIEKRIPLVLEGKIPAQPVELLEMAQICRKYKKEYPSAVQLYQDLFKAQPALLENNQCLYEAARAAALAGSGAGEQGAKLNEEEKAKYRGQAITWLEASLRLYAAGAKENDLDSLLRAVHSLPLWQKEPALAGLRDAKAIAQLPLAEKQACEKLWAELPVILKAAERRFSDTRFHTGEAIKESSNSHVLTMKAGKTYVLDVEETPYHTNLKLDHMGETVATGVYIDDDSRNARVIFTPTVDGTYQLNVNSRWGNEIGAYTLRVRWLDR